MPLLGTAFVIMWHDIAPEADAEYNRWHTREHMPERIALPGFLRARRGVNRTLDRQHYLTLYEMAGPESALSPEYLGSLNQPTAWTKAVAPYFRNFLRMACAPRSSVGNGVGGALATFRLTLGERSEAALHDALVPASEALMALHPVSAVHLAFARPAQAGGATTETAIRPPMAEPAFDAVVIVEGIGLVELASARADIARILTDAGAGEPISQCYDMAYLLMPAAA